MPASIASCLLKDFVYQQDEKTRYVFQNDKFVLVNRDEIADTILMNIDAVFDRYFEKGELSSVERLYDPFALNQALCRYSRDIFGEKRLHARISYFVEKYNVLEADIKEIMNYEDYGLKVDSCSPYIHRRIAGLFYWFSSLKPFRVNLKSTISESENTYIYLEYHNEFTTYIMVMIVLECLNCKIDIHEDIPLFRQFLYDLHYRKLSRSALEFFLNHHIYPKE
jgi:hypothetical protein